MLTEDFAILVKELGIGSLQGPSELRSVILAAVHLVTFGMNLQKELLMGGRLKLLRDLLSGGGERKYRTRGYK
jgi:hypothetical protein